MADASGILCFFLAEEPDDPIIRERIVNDGDAGHDQGKHQAAGIVERPDSKAKQRQLERQAQHA